jgi:hypothetical protein
MSANRPFLERVAMLDAEQFNNRVDGGQMGRQSLVIRFSIQGHGAPFLGRTIKLCRPPGRG